MSKLQDFKLLKIIGDGSYALVFAAEHNQKIYALKAVKKERARKSTFGITEKNILKNLQHPFIIEFYSCFTTATCLCYILEYAPGGDLMYYVNAKNRKLPLESVVFYAAELSLAISFLHSNGIIHRDIKLKNILIAKDGHIKLTDYGSAVELNLEGRRKSIRGTVNYMAPEVYNQELYNYEIDWWSFGACLYFMLYGTYPLMFEKGASRKRIEDIFKEKISFPESIPVNAVTFLKGLLEKDPNKRLGKGGFHEIRSHVFFADINWTKLEQKKIKPPFEPNVKSSTDFRYFDPQKVREPCSLANKPDWFTEAPPFEDFDYVNPNWKQ